MAPLIVIIIVLGGIGLCIWAAMVSEKRDRKRIGEWRATLEAWLEEQKALPRYHLSVRVGRKTYLTANFEPTYHIINGWHEWAEKHTSQHLAVHAKEQILLGKKVFTNRLGESFPACNITSIKVVESK